MTGIRSACIGRGAAAAGASIKAYTVPPDHTLILKDVLMGGSSGISTTYTIYVVSADGSVYVNLANQPANTTGWARWEGWMALNAGDYISVQPTGGAIQYWISGAVLPEVA
jgi:hypothetical protein